MSGPEADRVLWERTLTEIKTLRFVAFTEKSPKSFFSFLSYITLLITKKLFLLC